MDILAGREIIFEFRTSGGFTQVSAVDCATGLEVCVTTPSNALRSDQQTLALRKLSKSLIEQNEIVPEMQSQRDGNTTINKSKSAKPGILA